MKKRKDKEVNAVASLRFNFDGDKRPERGRAPMNPYSMRNLGYPLYGRPLAPPVHGRIEEPYVIPVVEETEQATISDETEKAETLQYQDGLTIGDGVEPDEDQNYLEKESQPAKEKIKDSIPEAPEESAKTASEKLVGKLEVFETGLINTREHLNQAKLFFDDVIYKMESFQQIMDILKANEERKTAGISAQAVSSKTTRDSIDDFLELLQTPAFQNVLRQLLLGIMGGAKSGNPLTK